MESFTRYLNSQPTYTGQLFYSNPPSTALLLWSTPTILPTILGISFVTKHNTPYQSGYDKDQMKELLLAKINTIPILDILYDFDTSRLIIDGVEYSLKEGATAISESFHVALGTAPSKTPNNPNMISDPFHVWSREAFDGVQTRKADVDLIVLHNNALLNVVEIKRSDKRAVGRWNPYITADRANYLLQFEFARLLEIGFVVVHHDKMDDCYDFTGEERVDIFAKQHPVGAVNDELLRSFAADNNRLLTEVRNLIRR